MQWWKGDPTRKEIYPDPKPKSSSTIPNKPDYQLDITDIEVYAARALRLDDGHCIAFATRPETHARPFL